MTKVKADSVIVCYTQEINFNSLDSITVLKGDSTIDISPSKVCIFKNFNDLYKMVLNILSNNNYYVNRYNEFGARFYNINFIEHNKQRLEKHGMLLVEQENR